MAHGKKKQSTGSWHGKRDKHQQTNPKGPGHKPNNSSPGYTKDKYKKNNSSGKSKGKEWFQL